MGFYIRDCEYNNIVVTVRDCTISNGNIYGLDNYDSSYNYINFRAINNDATTGSSYGVRAYGPANYNCYTGTSVGQDTEITDSGTGNDWYVAV